MCRKTTSFPEDFNKLKRVPNKHASLMRELLENDREAVFAYVTRKKWASASMLKVISNLCWHSRLLTYRFNN